MAGKKTSTSVKSLHAPDNLPNDGTKVHKRTNAYSPNDGMKVHKRTNAYSPKDMEKPIPKGADRDAWELLENLGRKGPRNKELMERIKKKSRNGQRKGGMNRGR